MGIDALFRADDGEQRLPTSAQDWEEWVSATRTRNYILGDPILDWLDLYGADKGFKRDDEQPTYDPRTDFSPFIFAQGKRFEQAVMAHIGNSRPITTISTGPEAARNRAKAEETFSSMAKGAEIIYQGVLWDAQNRLYGIPDMLVRSDVLISLFPGALTPSQAATPAPHLPGAKWHYRVVDVKFRMLDLLVGGDLDNGGSAPAYKLQLFIYNRALGKLQGYTAPQSYLLGRGWTQGDGRGFSCMDRLAPIPQNGTLAAKRPIAEGVEAATAWIRRVRNEGSAWVLLPSPSTPELYPNNGNTEDGPWHNAKKQITADLKDLTLLWQVGVPARSKGHAAGIYQWTDQRVTPEILGITSEKRAKTLSAILRINTETTGDPIQPAHIEAARDEWHSRPALEFYVDFETVSDLADDFSLIPKRHGQPLIFMIGCGHLEAGKWQFRCFVANSLAEADEANIIDQWLAYMESIKVSLLPPAAPPPKLIHWSPAEVSNFETAYNAAKTRHPSADWPVLPWFDFLQKVIREEPVVTRGAMAFGLKAVAKAMYGHGVIDTIWGDGPTDGLGAMVGAWWCNLEATRTATAMPALPLMQEIVAYNEVDCKVMMEVVRYLRNNR